MEPRVDLFLAASSMYPTQTSCYAKRLGPQQRGVQLKAPPSASSLPVVGRAGRAGNVMREVAETSQSDSSRAENSHMAGQAGKGTLKFLEESRIAFMTKGPPPGSSTRKGTCSVWPEEPAQVYQTYSWLLERLLLECPFHTPGLYMTVDSSESSMNLTTSAEKTEVLSEDLLQVEKRLELVKQVSHSTHKKLTACLQGQQGAEADKRSKKLPLTTLAQCLMEGSAILGDDTLLGKMLKLCGETEDKLAQELIHFELQVERDVIEPLFLLAEVEIPNIQKQRKHLAKLVLDMDSSRTRWQQTSKSSGLSSSLQPAGAKADALREEMEEAANRVEICRVSGPLPLLFRVR
ncbi:hypothetical protein STEG23_017361, partial [Scotinomys teguina]